MLTIMIISIHLQRLLSCSYESAGAASMSVQFIILYECNRKFEFLFQGAHGRFCMAAHKCLHMHVFDVYRCLSSDLVIKVAQRQILHKSREVQVVLFLGMRWVLPLPVIQRCRSPGRQNDVSISTSQRRLQVPNDLRFRLLFVAFAPFVVRCCT